MRSRFSPSRGLEVGRSVRPARLRLLAAASLWLLVSTAAWSEPAPEAGRRDANCVRSQFRVVLDIGHTAEAPGAKSARGVSEYEFNAQLGRRLEKALLDAGFDKTVLLITAGPARRGLYSRVKRANKAPAHLLVSIHHDSVPEQFKQDWEYGGVQHRFSDQFKGHSIFVSNDNPDRKGSLLFGRLLGKQLKQRGLQYTPHYTEAFMGSRRRQLLDAEAGVYRFDQLIVLRATRMPAVLFEAGSIINRDEELKAGSGERQRLISDAAVEAIAAFCDARSPARRRSASVASAGRDTPIETVAPSANPQ